jgi:hypothetical protein
LKSQLVRKRGALMQSRPAQERPSVFGWASAYW